MFHIESDAISLFTLSCPARIWKVRTDPFSRELALELRDESSKSVSYGWVAEDAKELKLVEGLEKADWWTGLEDFREGVIWVHGYEEEGLPLHQGLAAVDVRSGEVLWELPAAAYYGMVQEGILVKDTGQDAVGLLDIRTATSQRTYDDARGGELHRPMDEYHQQQNRFLKFPSVVQQGGEGFGEWVEKIGSTPFGPFWVAESSGYGIVAWHEGAPGDGFALALAVFQGDELQLDGWLEEGMKGMHPDPFFLHHGRVIAVRKKLELVMIDLPGPSPQKQMSE